MGLQDQSQGTFADRLALSIAEVAQVIGVGRSTIYRLIGAGSLPARKVGQRTVILKEDAIAFLRSAPRRTDVDESEA